MRLCAVSVSFTGPLPCLSVYSLHVESGNSVTTEVSSFCRHASFEARTRSLAKSDLSSETRRTYSRGMKRTRVGFSFRSRRQLMLSPRVPLASRAFARSLWPGHWRPSLGNDFSGRSRGPRRPRGRLQGARHRDVSRPGARRGRHRMHHRRSFARSLRVGGQRQNTKL